MATPKELQEAFINFGVFYLNNREISQDIKVLEIIVKFLDKQELDLNDMPKVNEGSVAAKKLSEAKEKAGVK